MTAAHHPVFVVGTAYSGHDVLSWSLAQHPHLTHAIDTRWLVKLATDLESLHALSGTGRPTATEEADLAIQRSRFYQLFGQAASQVFLSDNLLGANLPARRWVDATPGHASCVAGLMRLFPEARFIHVLRDVSSVARLLVQTPPNGTTYTWKSAHEYWLRTTKALLGAELAFGSSALLRIRYSDLVRDPEQTLRTCLEFVGEPFAFECLRPFNGLGGSSAEAVAEPIREEVSSVQDEAELFSDLLLQNTARNPARIARLDAAFGRRRSGTADRRGRTFVQRVQDVARSALPPNAAVLVISKGDDALLDLGCRKAGHFPQDEDGVYAGFHPASSDEAIEHLTTLRRQGFDYLLIPGPYFWWLEHYDKFARHLRNSFRIVCYQEDTCMLFELKRTPRGWSTPIVTGGRKAGRQAAAPAPTTARRQRPAPKLPAMKPSAVKASAVSAAPTAETIARKKLVQRLWGGFSLHARPALAALAESMTTPAGDRIEALWELARWYMVDGDVQASLDHLHSIARIDPSRRLAKRHLLLEVRALLALGRTAEARALLELGRARYGDDVDVCLLSANVAAVEASSEADTAAADERRLAAINRLYVAQGLQPIRKIDAARRLGLDNITTTAAPASPGAAGGPLVSVIVPACNAAGTIRFALAGLREQTWTNLEIIVVDDASTDETAAIVAEIAAEDPRIRLIRREQNGGTYLARNRGLEAVTGDYVTVHDADDWSHAQKIATQVALHRQQNAIATLSCWARATIDLRFTGPWRPTDRLVDENYSSLLIETRLLRELGGWDPVRTGADGELRRRLEAKYGKARVAVITGGLPWSFSLDDERSLTRQRATHASTLLFGVRREYRRWYERWHLAAARTGDFVVDPRPDAPRRFPAPAPILSAREAVQSYDLVLVCDFGIAGGALLSPYHYVLAAVRLGLRVGIFHWRRYDLDLTRGIDERLAQLVDAGAIDVIVPEQAIETKHLVFYYPPIYQHRLDRVPSITFERMYVVVNQMAHRRYKGTDPQYDPAVVRENLEALFGSSGEWFPISPLVRELMAADPRYPPAGSATWVPLLNIDEWCAREPTWRGRVRQTPVIGRHGRDHYTKWPETRLQIEQAYCVNRGWETRFLGGAAHAVRVLGRQPDHWTVWPFDSMPTPAFLSELDFLIHVPHEDYIEEFGRVVMEAMAVGIPVVVPTRFATTFGDAAICCEPAEVADRIEAIWRDEARYLEQVRRGRDFVHCHCAFDQLAGRLGIDASALAAAPKPGPKPVHRVSAATVSVGRVNGERYEVAQTSQSDNVVAPAPAGPPSTPTYWERRSNLMYYRYVDALVRAFAADATSLLDVGSRNTPIIEQFDWIPRRHALDIEKPYGSASVTAIKADFFAFEPDDRYDFAMCLQVLEHIPDAKRFARRLFDVADNVLVSVPFMWPKGYSHHVHDPVSLEKLVGWAGRKPTYHVVVTEPLTRRESRLIAYFHDRRVPFSLRAAAERIGRIIGGGPPRAQTERTA